MPRLDKLCSPSLVKVGLKAADKKAAISAAVDLLVASGKATDRDGLLKAVLDREALAPTSIGEGCAIPHAKTDFVTEPALAIVSLAKPIDFGDPDGVPVRLVFLAVSARDQAGEHLRILSKLARMLSGPELRAALASAPDSGTFRAALVEADPAAKD